MLFDDTEDIIIEEIIVLKYKGRQQKRFVCNI